MWQDEAIAAAASMRARFKRKDGPGFTFSGKGNEELLVNARDLFDKATPSSSGSAVWALARLALRTGDRDLASEAREAVEEVSWLMARSPHGTESWFFALETLLEFEDKYGFGAGFGVSSSVKRGGGAGEAPVRVEAAAVEPKIVRGGKGAIRLRLTIADGWHLQEPGGLRIEARIGEGSGSDSGFTFEEIPLPAPERIEDTTGEVVTGRQGTVEANLSFSLSSKASEGRKEITVRVRYRACGEGACRPEAVLSIEVPVEIV